MIHIVRVADHLQHMHWSDRRNRIIVNSDHDKNMVFFIVKEKTLKPQQQGMNLLGTYQ
jgi:hypothetical protein